MPMKNKGVTEVKLEKMGVTERRQNLQPFPQHISDFLVSWWCAFTSKLRPSKPTLLQ